MIDDEDDFEDDDIDLERFEAQQDERVRGAKFSHYEQAVDELRKGRKQSLWMWFVFPQCDGISEWRGGKPSEMTLWFGVAGLSEATAYLGHEALGPRLIECFQLCLDSGESDPSKIFGAADAAKLHACATLFSRVEGADPVFAKAIDTFFNGKPCDATVALTGDSPAGR
ncbi:MAG: DUF1810 family protein [Paracoccaceae bacterium]